jgi:hypothetical protein
MTEKEHYNCKHFQSFDDGVAVDYYCNHKKEWFWMVGKTPICEFFEEED